MTANFFPKVGTVLRSVFAVTTISLANVPAAFADDINIGLQKLLAEPTSFVAISEGAPGPVTYASMVGDTLLVQFTIPTHSGDAFGEVVGKVQSNGQFDGNEVLIREDGKGRSSVVSMTFQDDGMIVSHIDGDQEGSGFMPRAAFNAY